MSGQNNSAEIVELNDARARLRAAGIDPKNFPAVGSYLEAVRAQQSLTLATISERTHIKASYIEAIEQMALERLPNRAYGVGFVRAYADALGLDPVPVIERFKAESGMAAASASATPTRPVMPAAPASGVAPEPPRLSLLAVLAILALMIWSGLSITRPRETSAPLKLDGVPLRPAVDGAAVIDPTLTSGPAVAPATAAPAGPRVVAAQMIERIEPVYPPECEAAAAAVETVDVTFTITPDGIVVSERVADASNVCFERSALNALKRWRFSPQTKDGAPQPAFEQRVSFRFDRPS